MTTDELKNEDSPHHWPEFKDGYDVEINDCAICDIAFYGFFSRLQCHKCAYEGVNKIEKVKR